MVVGIYASFLLMCIFFVQVSRHAKQILQLRYKKPEINLQELNPALFNFVDELHNVRVSFVIYNNTFRLNIFTTDFGVTFVSTGELKIL